MLGFELIKLGIPIFSVSLGPRVKKPKWDGFENFFKRPNQITDRYENAISISEPVSRSLINIFIVITTNNYFSNN